MNPRFHNALRGIAQPTPPIWFMRQAGRYHQHYQKLRKEHSFMDLCKKPKLAAEVALGPVADFDFDVSILFSDLLFPLEALGMGLTYDPGPKLALRLDHENIRKLKPWAQALPHLEFQREAMQETRKVLPADKSLIGFVGGPWTLFSYAIEGEHKGHLIPAKTSFALYAEFCETLVPLLAANIELQFQGGAEVVMIFDTAAGELSPLLFKKFLEPQLLTLAKKFPGRLGYYAKGTTVAHTKGLRATTLFAGFGFDHRFDLPEILHGNVQGFVQGNFDQALLFSSTEDFTRQLSSYLQPYLNLTPVQRRHWVCGLGHGVLPGTPERHVRQLIHTVRETFA